MCPIIRKGGGNGQRWARPPIVRSMPLTAKPDVGTIDKKGARSYWDAATGFGQPNATTTFSDVYNKEDFTYVDDDTYEGDRAKSLGYLTHVKLIKFLRTKLSELTSPPKTAAASSAAPWGAPLAIYVSTA